MHLDSHNPFILEAAVGILSAAPRSHASVGIADQREARGVGGLLLAEGAKLPRKARTAGRTNTALFLGPNENRGG